jgi:hypothetical protein
VQPDDTNPEVARLRERLERAFADRPYPGDDAIGTTDSRYPDYEGHRVGAFHRGRDWRTFTVRQLLDGYAGDVSACLAFMAPDGWR